MSTVVRDVLLAYRPRLRRRAVGRAARAGTTGAGGPRPRSAASSWIAPTAPRLPTSRSGSRTPDAAVKTDDAGRFELTGVSPGRRTVYVSVVGFILVRRPVDVAPGATVELTIVLTRRDRAPTARR